MLLDSPICDFGWPAPEFSLEDFNGKTHKMSQHLGENGLVIMFICNHCPYVKAIAGRLSDDMKTLQDHDIGVIAVMTNDYRIYAEDSPENMKRFSEHYGFTFPYLIDEDQSVGKAYGAICTPDFFGLNGQGTLQYRGRLDDAKNQSDSSPKRELVNAMLLIKETGAGPNEQVPSMGCSIKWT